MLAMIGCSGADTRQGSGGGGYGTGGGGGGGETTTPCPDDEYDIGNGVCLPCPPGTMEVADGCQPAGVLPDGCADGFVHDGDVGCEPTLPAGLCPAGQMAVPGDSTCREVAPCGNGPWGDIVTDGDTVYVDGSYAGGTSNGSAADPWTTIQQGISAAADGAVIAIAEGSYAEDPTLSKPVTLWGRCPALVELVGSGSGWATLTLYSGAAGGTVRGLAIRGPAMGVIVLGASDVSLQELWVHDNDDRGVNVEHATNGASVTVSDCLIEDNRDHGAIATGASLTVLRTMVRGTQPWNGIAGPGLGIQGDPQTGEQSSLTVSDSLIALNHDGGVGIYGGVTTIDGTVIRDTQPGASGEYGRGLSVQPDHITGLAATVTVTRSLLADNQEVGIYNGASALTVEDTVIRDTVPNSQGKFGRGLSLEAHPFNGDPATATVTRSFIVGSPDTNVFQWGSQGEFEASVLRGSPRGFTAQLDSDLGHPSTLDVDGCVVEAYTSAGIILFGATATITGTAIIGGDETSDYDLRGVNLQRALATGTPASVSLLRSRIEHHQGTAIAVFDAIAVVDQCLVRDTIPDIHNTYGDAFGVTADHGLAELSVSNSSVDATSRAAVFNFGGKVSLQATRFRCQAIDLNGEDGPIGPSEFVDAGGNRCGCPTPTKDCVLISTGLTPPSPLAPLEK